MAEPDDERIQKLESQLKRKADEIGILTRVAAKLTGTLELEPLLSAMLLSMDEVFGFQRAGRAQRIGRKRLRQRAQLAIGRVLVGFEHQVERAPQRPTLTL